MSRLIEELKGEHRAIVDLLDKVREIGIGSPAGQQKLLTAKEGLLAHLKKEDEKLYPVLEKAGKSDENLKHTMDLFAKDMATISQAAMDFFQKYSEGGSGLEFAKDYGRLFITLGGRIKKEEDILYREYEKLI